MIIQEDQIDLRTTPALSIPDEMSAAVERVGAILRVALSQLGGGVVQFRWCLRVRRPGGIRTLVDYEVGQVLPPGAEALELQAIGRPAPDVAPVPA